MRTIYWFYSLVFLWTGVFADVEPVSPSEGDTFTVDGSTVKFNVTFKDDGESPNIKDALSFTLLLMTGPNDDIEQRASLASSITLSDLDDNTYQASVEASVGADGYYYVQIYADYGSQSYTIHYTDRFKLEGMTGTLKTSGTGDPPEAQQISVQQSINSAWFTIPYTKQTGKTRYAPMQTQPGSKVTATTWSRRFPASSVTYYSTISGTPVVYSTITAGWSYTMSSLTNYATPAPFPSEVGWYAPSKRLQSATLDSSYRKMKKRRWDD
ncbi:hypothetical protein KL925_004423 [Ogataea polymorpha]|uniref:uncharacterized protein n=1 Tax=Ogataea polymorpha TaxID=460523 RepID=UPI0007F4C34A|nr:uncharacterized protein OGAPODRAFT_24043 [Ogataea polymorpha]KAG7890466.1 hypothetical protein KL908_004303 [Ogataea polymorpha]KAG7907340.1 hypothetical protein KL906_004027 [Ogataea polymorpha]KAG7915169.1 hypothetical protein KL927_004158 [Ogataea polymorpha]KAG7925408.1 hypothetical protein KL925_004423 [Ogataea polymorpha]KAG7932375.1 hypothetical protein KL934_003818 [Ogataea polymorpha]